MLKSLQRWLFGPPAPPGWSALKSWCESRDLQLRPTRERDGFVIEPLAGEVVWRMEWGPSQRAYIGSHELRLRADTGIDPATYALLMPRALMGTLERNLFSQITDGVQTRMDDETPEEIRWLAMAPRLGAAQMGDLQAAYGAVGNVPEWMPDWLCGRLQPRLLDQATSSSDGWVVNPLFVLVAQRGRLVMRMSLVHPEAEALGMAVALFEVALAEARRIASAA